MTYVFVRKICDITPTPNMLHQKPTGITDVTIMKTPPSLPSPPFSSLPSPPSLPFPPLSSLPFPPFPSIPSPLHIFGGKFWTQSRLVWRLVLLLIN